MQIRGFVKWLTLLVLPSLALACARSPQHIAADIVNCERLEGVQLPNGDQNVLVKCLVDRYGWKPEEASLQVADYVRNQYQELDSSVRVEARSDSLRRFGMTAQGAQRDSLKTAEPLGDIVKTADGVYQIEYAGEKDTVSGTAYRWTALRFLIRRVRDKSGQQVEQYELRARIREPDGTERSLWGVETAFNPGVSRVALTINGSPLSRPLFVNATRSALTLPH